MPKLSTSHTGFCRQRQRRIVLTVLGISLVTFGILCGIYWEYLFQLIMAKEMVLRPNSRVSSNWQSPPFDLGLDIYLFNWTNPHDFNNLSTKPILKQLGPYRFKERPEKVDIVWHSENSSVTYRKKSDFFFDAAASQGSLEDEVMTLNAVALSAAAKSKQWNVVARSVVDVGLTMYGQEMSVLKTVDELLFTGYEDEMITIARAMPIFGKNIEVPFDKFGWFYTRNGSADLQGVFNVYTGADDIAKLGQMHSWNYKTNTGFYESYCGMTNGSAGEFQPSNLQKGGSVSLFTPDMCRTVHLDYVGMVEVDGIMGYKYAGGIRSIDNGTLFDENRCFCGGECAPSGVMNISACRFGSPVFMSYPHFFNGDPYYVQQVEGLRPVKEDHEFYMILEPKTGLALEVAARFQVNMLVEPIVGLNLYTKIPRIFFPLIWFEQKVRIPHELAENLRLLPYVVLAGQIIAGACLAFGLLLLLWYLLDKLRAHRASLELKSTPPSHNREIMEKITTISTELKSPDISPLIEKSNSASKPKIVEQSTKSTSNEAHGLSGSIEGASVIER